MLPLTDTTLLLAKLQDSSCTGIQDSELGFNKSKCGVEQQQDFKQMLQIVKTARIKQKHLDNNKNSHLFEQRDISLEISDNPDPDKLKERVARLFNQVFGLNLTIAASQVTVGVVNGALTNTIYRVTIDNAPAVPATQAPNILRAFTGKYDQQSIDRYPTIQLPRKFLLRIYGPGTYELLPKKTELHWLSQLSLLGFGAKIYGVFANGRLEEFVENTRLTEEDIRQPDTSSDIAQTLCKFQYLFTHYELAKSINNNMVSNGKAGPSKQPCYWNIIDNWMKLIAKRWPAIQSSCQNNKKCMEILNNWPTIEQTVQKYRNCVEKAHIPVVFGHNDLQNGNILRLHSTEKLLLVDFEYAGYNYRSYDIANHFHTWLYADDPVLNMRALSPMQYPTSQQRYSFLRTYILTKAFIDANLDFEADNTSPNMEHGASALLPIELCEKQVNKEIKELDSEVTLLEPAPFLLWALWALLEGSTSKADYNYAQVAVTRMSGFLALVDNDK